MKRREILGSILLGIMGMTSIILGIQLYQHQQVCHVCTIKTTSNLIFEHKATKQLFAHTPYLYPVQLSQNEFVIVTWNAEQNISVLLLTEESLLLKTRYNETIGGFGYRNQDLADLKVIIKFEIAVNSTFVHYEVKLYLSNCPDI